MSKKQLRLVKKLRMNPKNLVLSKLLVRTISDWGRLGYFFMYRSIHVLFTHSSIIFRIKTCLDECNWTRVLMI